MNLTENARKLLEDRYLRRIGDTFESPSELFRRVAKTIAAADLFYKKTTQSIQQTEEAFYNMMINLDFLPNSPTLLNAGSRRGQLSACFVLPVEDSIQGIFSTMKDAAEIHKSGGGTGFSFSRLRSAGSPVQGSKLFAQGPLAYLNLFNEAMGTVEQGGVRRGGNMGIMRIDHPDIIDFIRCKSCEGDLKNFNLSVAVTDEFMQCIEHNTEFSFADPHTKKKSSVKPEEIWNVLTNASHANGEPGVIFIDAINRHNPTPEIPMEATNPCGEQPLLPYESCILGSINLSRFVRSRGIDYDRLGKTVDLAIHFFDNLIDVNTYPLPRLKEMAEANRKVGLGVMGFADMLIALNIPYDSEISLRLTNEIMSFIRSTAVDASRKLAQERGSFPNFKRSIYAEDQPLRNATLTTIAPTGSISMIAGCSAGIEPLFAVSYRNIGQREGYWIVNPLFENIAKTEGFYSENLMKQIDLHKGSVQEISGVPESCKRLFLTASDISPEWHVRIQAAFQKNVDNAVSKTVNLPNSATIEDVSRLYKLAWELGCKGITIYRDGSRKDQPVTAEKSCPAGVCPL
jgi:ribonucleoside-diphosphate reductase alpha chain